MRYCNECCMPETKPGVTIDASGRCNGCRTAQLKETVNWMARWEDLEKIVAEIKSNKRSGYDCLVPVSGGKDSWYQAWVMAKHFGLKVLCAVMGAHLPTTEGIHNLNTMISDLNVDTIKITLKQSVTRSLRKKCFLKQAEPNWAEHCSVLSGVVNVALLYDTPLIVWGEDINFEFGGTQMEDSKPSALDIDKSDLMGEKTIDHWLDDDISIRDVFFYQYPEYARLKEANIQSIYLGHFHKWDGRAHYEFVKQRGFKSRALGPLSGNYIDYDNIDEKLCEINIWLKYIKFGFWRATDQTCYDIWNKRLSRDEAVKIIKKLQDEFPIEYFEDFLIFHNLSSGEFWETVEKFRNKEIWTEVEKAWRLKTTVS